MAVLIREGVTSQPWGDKPPPLPAGSDRDHVTQIATAFKVWRKTRPTYTREGNEIVCRLDFKGKVWEGRAVASNENDDSLAAWWALQGCIESWLDDTDLLRGLKKRFSRRGREASG